MSYKTKVEKRAFRNGIAFACKKAKSKEFVGNSKTKTVNSKVNTKTVLPKNNYDFSEEHKLAYLYAKHMGDKFGLSDLEVKQNFKEHFEQAKTDSKFRSFLYRNYGD